MRSGSTGSARHIRAAWAALLGWVFVAAPGSAGAQTKEPKAGSTWHSNTRMLLAKVQPSTAVPGGWVVESPTHVVHSTMSKEYTAAAAAHLWRFDIEFRKIFKGAYRDRKKPVAYAFRSEKEYLAFSPGSDGTQGRFLCEIQGKNKKKNLAWFSTPAGEQDFYKTDFEVVQHEATHQLLDAYTDNQDIPSWFQEGCATFFESWDLARSSEQNILSGIGGRYSLGIALTCPEQVPPPPLTGAWIPPRRFLSNPGEHRRDDGPVFRVRPGTRSDPVASFYQELGRQQPYNEAWCVMTFLIHHKRGQEIFKKLVDSFQKGATFQSIQKTYYSETFLASFEKEWSKFIAERVLKRWDLPTAGGEKLRPGSFDPPPSGRPGVALWSNRRGDTFIVDAEGRKLQCGDRERRVMLLKAWSMPIVFYEEAWKAIQSLLTKKAAPFVGGIYAVTLIEDGNGLIVASLAPAWSTPPADDAAALSQRIGKAARAMAGRIPIDVLLPGPAH